jgi:hypothetical protein
MARDPDPSPAPNQGTAIWGWNGIDWEVVKVNSDGNVQIDVVSTIVWGLA